MNFPFTRAIVVVRVKRDWKYKDKKSDEIRYFVTSRQADYHTPNQWDEYVRGHWGGSEIRNHWYKDAIFKEDGTRSRNPRLIANVAIMRNIAVLLIARNFPGQNRAATKELLHSDPAACMKIVCEK